MTHQQKQINKVAKAYLYYQLLDEVLTEIDKPFIKAIKKQYKSKLNLLTLKIRIKDTIKLLKPLGLINLFEHSQDETQAILGAKELLVETLINGSLEDNAELANLIYKHKNK